tara:strand:+ start:346 stop:615 length:270 start_codon:yes stop_codon:yes gene_type:complete
MQTDMTYTVNRTRSVPTTETGGRGMDAGVSAYVSITDETDKIVASWSKDRGGRIWIESEQRMTVVMNLGRGAFQTFRRRVREELGVKLA